MSKGIEINAKTGEVKQIDILETDSEYIPAPTPEEIAEAETKVLITETLIELGVLA